MCSESHIPRQRDSCLTSNVRQNKTPNAQINISSFLTALIPVTSLFAADPLDFPDASFRVKIGTQATVVRANGQAKEIKIDGKSVRVGEILSSPIKVDWIIAPSIEVGDEYVFIVYRGKEKAKTYSVVFKSGYRSVVSEGDLTIEIEN